MDGATLSSYIGMGVQALSSGLGGIFTNNAIKKENQKNRDWNEKMWNLTNQYNSPVNQRKLYELAGLNPALLYGSNTSALSSYSGNLGTSENFKNPAENVDFNKAVEGIRVDNEKKAIESNIEVNNSTIEKNAASARKDDADASNAAAQANLNLLQGKLLQAQMNDLIDKMSVDLENARKEGLIKDEDYKIRKEQLKQQGEIFRRLEAEANTAEEVTNTQKAETGLVKAKTSTEYVTQDTLRKQGEYYLAASYEAREKGKTEIYERNKIASDIALNEDLGYKLRREGHLTSMQSIKVVADIAKTIAETGKINMETIRDEHGTNVAQIVHHYLRKYYKSIEFTQYQREKQFYKPNMIQPNHGGGSSW